MPRKSAWFVRLALICLAAGFTIGALLQANKGLGFAPVLWDWLPVHTELLLVGWLSLLAAGVAYWILPRQPGPAPRGNESLTWLALALLPLGIALVSLAALLPAPALAWPGRAIEIAGVLAFVAGSWKRVRAFQ